MSVIARDCVFFYGHSDGVACFSQFYPSEFTARTEQSTHGGTIHDGKPAYWPAATEKEILACSYDPKGIKDLGRRVTPFDEARGARAPECRAAAASSSLGNEPLRHILLGTNQLTLVEAAPNDAIWGIGIGVKDAAKGAVTRHQPARQGADEGTRSARRQ